MSVVPPTGAGREARQLVIVQRGRFATFERLTRAFADDSNVRVIWDRRVVDRRQSVAAIDVDRRRSDRRQTTSRWSPDGYVLARFNSSADF